MADRRIQELYPIAAMFSLRHLDIDRYVRDREKSSEKAKEVLAETCCSLPFSLQDLCLLAVINDLNRYPNELLASMPLWLRRRLLSCVPALELCRMSSTPVANGVDIDEIWKLTLPKVDKEAPSLSWYLHNRNSVFQFDVGYSHHAATEATKVLESKEVEIPPQYKFLFKIASQLISNSCGHLEMTKNNHQLISISGEVVLPNLVSGAGHHACENPSSCNAEAWKRQTTALAVDFRTRYRGCLQKNDSYIQLTPHYFLPVPDAISLLLSLVRECQLRPVSANIRINSISSSFLSALRSERLCLDCNMSLPREGQKCSSIVSQLLEKVVVLGLDCDKYGDVGVMMSMIKAAIASAQESKLSHLYCTLSDLYVELVDPLSSLFSLKNFQHLSLELSDVYTLNLAKLICAFMSTPGPSQQVQTLKVHVKTGIPFPSSIAENQLATMKLDVGSIPSCSAKYKKLEFDSPHSFTNALYLLLQFPVVQLKQITLVHLHEYHIYFHLCATHPDLQVVKLVVEVNSTLCSEVGKLLPSFKADLVTLVSKPSLNKIVFRGNWGQSPAIKDGLVQALACRAHLFPLKKLSLELESQQYYKVKDFELLFDTIFSLPQLENLKLVLGKGFSDMIRQEVYGQTLYNSWCGKSAQIKLNSVVLQTPNQQVEQLNLSYIAQKVSFKVLFEEPFLEKMHIAPLDVDDYWDYDRARDYLGYDESSDGDSDDDFYGYHYDFDD